MSLFLPFPDPTITRRAKNYTVGSVQGRCKSQKFRDIYFCEER